MLPTFKVFGELESREGVEGVAIWYEPHSEPQCKTSELSDALQQAVKLTRITSEWQVFIALNSCRITVQKWHSMTVAIAVTNGHPFNKSLQRKLERLRELYDAPRKTAVQSPQWAPPNGQRVL